MSGHTEWDLALARRAKRQGWGERLLWMRCEQCGKRRYVIPSPGWPTCHSRVMQAETQKEAQTHPSKMENGDGRS
jgi:hypothetical protein